MYFSFFCRKQTFFSKILNLFLLGFCLTALFRPINLVAQESNTNAINLSISYVETNGRVLENKLVGPNQWVQEDVTLTSDSVIRYGWNNLVLNVFYRDQPTPGGGFLKIYLNDDTREENFITDYGSSPLPVSQIKSRLENGKNKILFVLYTSKDKLAEPVTKVSFTFNYRNESSQPSLELIEPKQGSIIAKEIPKDFRLYLKNFRLEPTSSKEPDRGQLQVYVNEIRPENLLLTVKNSVEIDTAIQLVQFSSKDFERPERISDSKNTRLIFTLAYTNGTLLNPRNRLEVDYVTNFNNTLNIGLPKVQIIEPSKNRTDLNITGERKFIVSLENFELLKEFTQGPNEDLKGYLQIFVNNQPIKTNWPKTEFTLNEIGYASTQEGKRTVKVQLVNKDFTLVTPPAEDSIEIIYQPDIVHKAVKEEEQGQIQNSVWRVIIVSLIVILVFAGIGLLIFRS